MNILELIKNEKVEWKRLGEVCESITTGLNPRNNFVLNDENEELNCWYITTKDYSESEEIEFIEGKTAKISQKAKEIINKRSKLEKDDILFSAVGTVGKIAVIKRNPINFDVNESTFVLKPKKSKIKTNFLSIYLRSKYIQNEILKNLRGSTLSGIRKGNLERFKIPVPSLEVQKRIVEKLDKFTEYITELQAELQNRLKQYAYYRDLILSEDYLRMLSLRLDALGEIRHTTLGEIGEFTRGNGLQKKDFRKKGYPVVHYGQIYTRYGFSTKNVISYTDKEIYKKLRKAKQNDILLATTSENIKDLAKCVVWEGKEEIGISGDMYKYSTNENSKYIAYYMQTNFFQLQKERRITGAKIKRIHSKDMEKFKISLPPLSVQKHVVKVLDKFQDLIEDTKGLLPEEIEQRRKEYEHYRNILLTFNGGGVIPSEYYETLLEAAKVVGVELSIGLEWKRLNKLMDYEQPTKYIVDSTEYDDKFNTPVLTAGQTFILGYSKETEGIYKASKKKPVIIFDDFTTSNHWVDFEFKVKSSAMKILKAKNDSVKLRYCYHCIKTKNIDISDHKRMWISEFSKLKIPIPSLAVQEHVVGLLDKFDALVNDVKMGLPKEIELRDKEYKYFRDKLLDFKM